MPGNRRWTAEELNQLTWSWAEQDVRTIARRVGRSTNACYDKARELGLGDCGGLSKQEASERSGLDEHTLLRALEFAGVRPRRSRVSRGEGLGRRWAIDVEDLDRAVAAWVASAPVATHAAALGMDHKCLRRWLVAAGHQPPTGNRKEWRVSDAVVAQVVASNRARQVVPKLGALARSLRVSREKLKFALEAAGCRREARVWLVTEKQAREALEAWDERGDRNEWWKRREAGAAAQRAGDALRA